MRRTGPVAVRRSTLVGPLTSLGIVAVAFVVGCSGSGSDFGPTETLTPSASRAISDGARLSGSLSPVLQVTSANGSITRTVLPSTSYSAQLHRGAAILPATAHPTTLADHLPAMTPLIASVAGRGGPHQKVATYADPSGHLHHLTVSMDGPRMLSSRETVDGVLFAEVQNRWDLQGATWILQGSDVTSYMNGQVVRLTVNTTPSAVASLSGIGRAKSLMARTGNAALSLITPTPAYADCESATITLVAASGGLAVVLMTPPPVDAILLAIAMTSHVGAIDDYNAQCAVGG